MATKPALQPKINKRAKFSYKGDYGHVLIAAGSFGKIGAALLSIGAALRSGAGLVTALVPRVGYEIMQIKNPEAMAIVSGENFLKEVPNTEKFNALAVGPGIGNETETKVFLQLLLKQYKLPIVIDADALNIISATSNLLKLLTPHSILTPHHREFERLVGKWETDEEKIQKQKKFSKTYNVIIVLKGANTSVSTPDGKMYFNITGNAGMAKGGSGDVLTGVIASLLAQKYSPAEAAILGVYIHGLAGDFAKEKLGETAMNASDIISYLPKAFKTLENPKNKS